jgi:hypothetical protein
MASSIALTVVNKVLSTTGDYSALPALTDSPANIAERVLDFCNITLADLEGASIWPALKVEGTFTGDGTTTAFTYLGAEDIPAHGISSVWVVGGDLLDELNTPQFDRVRAQGASGAAPKYFTRSFVNNKPVVEIYPAPAAASTVRTTMYRRATPLSYVASTTLTPETWTTTEFDDNLVVYGALMHLDAYDGMDRGYKVLYDGIKTAVVAQNTRNTLRVPLGEYVRWERKAPGAWSNPLFVESYLKDNPEYTTP